MRLATVGPGDSATGCHAWGMGVLAIVSWLLLRKNLQELGP